VADAQAVAQGQTGKAVKAARAQLQDAEDALEAARSAKEMLAQEQAVLSRRQDFSSGSLDSAIAAVVRSSPETRELIPTLRLADSPRIPESAVA
jgi:hypothetical protein